MKHFHGDMLEPFLARAVCIEKNLAILECATFRPKISEDIRNLRKNYNLLQNFSLPHIENKIGYQFKHENLFLILFLFREIAKIFNEVQNLEKNERTEMGIPEKTLSEMLQLKETMLSLAFIGDSAIETGVIRSIWPTDTLHTLPRKGTLDAKKKFFTVGLNQAILWNFLNLSPGRSSPSSPDSNRLKSSQFEALFGIIYLESGAVAVESAILTLKCNFEKNQEILS